MVIQGKTWVLTFIATAALVACGGGGGGSASPNNSTSLAGSVIDGAIEGASICLDLNNNLNCDISEPSATTKADGSYSLDTTGLTVAQIKTAHIFVVVPTTAKDADDGGKTLAQAGKASFSLLAPAENAISNDGSTSGNVVVSPLSTLVSHEMMLDGSGAEVAKGRVKNKLGLAYDVDITQNFVGKADSTNLDLARKARFLAAALGAVMADIGTVAPTTSAKTKLLGALDHLKTNAKAIIDAASSAPAGQTPVQAVQTALQTPALQPVANTLISNAQTAENSSPVIGATTADFEAIVKDGFYNGYCVSSSSSSVSSSTTYVCHQWSLNHTKSAEPSKWQGTRYYVNAGETSFFTSTSMPNSSYQLIAGAGWIQQSNPTTGTYSSVDTGLFSITQKWTNTVSESVNIRMSYKDVSGMKFSDLGSLGNLRDILLYGGTSNIGNTVFPAGSKMVQTRSEGQGDRYWLDPQAIGTINYSVSPYQTIPWTSLTELLSAYATPSGTGTPSGSAFFPVSNASDYNGPWYRGTFDAGGTPTGGQMTIWKNESGQTPVRLNEKASYTIKTVSGQTLLILNPSETLLAARAQNTGNRLGWQPIYAVREGKLYKGSFESSATIASLASAGTSWNRTAAQAIIQAMGMSSLPQ